MKIILTKNVDNLGKIGDIKVVADGYARNFLLPKELAQTATAENVILVEKQKAKQREEEKKLTESYRKMAQSLDKAKINIQVKEKDGKLFGSVGSKDIAKAILDKYFEIPEKSIILKEPIKKIGEYSVKIILPGNISTDIKVIVEPV